MKIKLLDLFSGIGGFHKGLEQAGFEVESYFSEIDKYAIQVYQNNFKKSKYVGSVTNVYGRNLPKIDAITFGSPCQDFSIAGKRKGMEGDRSSLISEAIRLVSECRPRFFVWENVKGTFSSNNGEDLWAIIQAFANVGGYRLEWQLLNTKWFLPQNRERIYLVGYIGNGSRGQVFPIRENNRKVDVIQRQQANTNCISARYNGIGNGSYVIERKFEAQEEVEIADYRTDEGLRIRDDKNSSCLTVTHSSETSLSAMPPSLLKSNTKIRKLTPIECERLQGFPDNWTKKGTEGLISDTQRYKMCGNAVTVDVVQAVAERIKNIL